jgi:LPS export ABC transporter protein LptC
MIKPWRHTLHNAVKLLLLLMALLAACDEKGLNIRTPAMDRNLPDETSTNVTITEFNGHNVDYILSAKRIERFYDRQMMNAYGTRIQAYDPKKGGTSLMEADSTIVDDARNMIYAYGNVKLVSPNGSIAAGRMIWDRNMDEIIAPGAVTLVRDGNTLRGNDLRTNTRIDYAEMQTVSAEGIFNEEDFDW